MQDVPLERLLPLPFLSNGEGVVNGSKKDSDSSSSEKTVRELGATLDRGTTCKVAAPPSTLLNELDTKH